MNKNIINSKFWKKYFKVYDILNNAYPYKKLLNLVISNLSKINNYKILDAGSGTGNLSIKLIKYGGKVYSLDNSKEGIDIHKSKDSLANIILHDLNKTVPFKDNFFDVIISLNTICFIDKENREKVFKEFYRILKNDGEIIVVNLLNNFKSYKIFIAHIREDIRINGLLKALKNILILLIPILKMFYYSRIIQKQNKSNKRIFFNINEQSNYLKKLNFRNISESELVFVNQAILNKAYK